MSNAVEVGKNVRIRHGRATLDGTVVSVSEDRRKCEVRIPRDGTEPLKLTRNVQFVQVLPDAPSGGGS